MTPLRKRMIEDLQLRGLSERTQEAYVRAVRQLAEHYHKSPDRITEEELRDYFLYLKNVKHYSAQNERTCHERKSSSLMDFISITYATINDNRLFMALIYSGCHTVPLNKFGLIG